MPQGNELPEFQKERNLREQNWGSLTMPPVVQQGAEAKQQVQVVKKKLGKCRTNRQQPPVGLDRQARV